MVELVVVGGTVVVVLGKPVVPSCPEPDPLPPLPPLPPSGVVGASVDEGRLVVGMVVVCFVVVVVVSSGVVSANKYKNFILVCIR